MAANIDRLIARFLPAIGAAFLAGGFGYLIYSEIWPHVPYLVRIMVGASAAAGFVMAGSHPKITWKSGADALSSLGVLIGYATLVYASRTGESAAVFGTAASLVVAFAFSAAASFVSVRKRSKTVLLASVLGAYLTPFFIGQTDAWKYALGYDAYLAYFLAVNVAMFVASRKMDLSEIVPVNGLAMMASTAFMRIIGFQDDLGTSATLAFGLHAAILGTLAFTAFRTERDREGNGAGMGSFVWIGPALWFLGNAYSFREGVPGALRAFLEIALGGAYFVFWNLLRARGAKAPGAYVAGTLLIVVGTLVFLHDSLAFAGILMGVVGAFVLLLGVRGGKDAERILAGMAFSAMGAAVAAYGTLDYWNDDALRRLSATVAVTIPLLPLLALSFVRKDGFPEGGKDFAEFAATSSWIAVGLMVFFNVVTIRIDPIVLFFSLPAFLVAGALAVFPIVPENGKRIAEGVRIWLALASIAIIPRLASAVFERPETASFVSAEGGYAVFGGIAALLLATVLKRGFGLGGGFVHKVMAVLAFLSAHFAIVAALSAFSLTSGGVLAVATTVYWAAVAVGILWSGLSRKDRMTKRYGFAALAFTVLKVVFYDLHAATTAMKVTVLMVVGAGLLAFSWYASKNGLLLEEDAENGSAGKEGGEPDPDSENDQDAEDEWEDVFPVVNRKIADVNLEDCTSALVTPLGAPAFRVNATNLLKIMKLVVANHGRREVYLPGELLGVYEAVIGNYRSELPKATYESVAATMKDFCERGGSVTFK